MTLTLSATQTNNADWKTQFRFTDGETGDPIDFAGAAIEVEIVDGDGCTRSTASVANGKIAITGTGVFEMTIPVLEMSNLCPGSYPIGGVYSLNGETISLFVGTLTVISGVARL